MHIVEQVLRSQGLGYVAERGKVSSDEELNLLSQNMLPTINGKIIISKDLGKELSEIIETIGKNGKNNTANELGFFMFGYELDNGDVMITKIISYFEEFNSACSQGKKYSYAFEEQNSNEFKAILKEVNDFIKFSTYKRPVFFNGHTHPDLTSVFGANSPFASGTNASWCDIEGLIETTKNVSKISQQFGKNVQYGHIIINSVLDFDVMSYQDFGDGYKLYKHPNIYYGEERLPSYTPGKYLIDDRQMRR